MVWGVGLSRIQQVLDVLGHGIWAYLGECLEITAALDLKV